MKPLFLALLLIACGLRLAAQPATTPSGKPAEQGDYFAKVVGFAQKLHAQHVNTQPLPNPPPNPFREPGVVEPEPVPTSGGDAPVPTLSGSALLNKLTAELRVTGMVTVAGRRALIINGTPRREGDTFTVKTATATHYLLLKTLGNGTALITMDGASATIRFRVN